jgi:DNA polymerase
MDKEKKLQNLKKEIEVCPLCKEDGIGVPVFGEGNPDAQVIFVGEAPGREEARTGRPFIGRSGKLLRSLINQIGLKEEDVYITSPVKYLPSYGTPKKKDIIHARTHFDKQLSIIDPQIVILLGKTAAYAVLDEEVAILTRHGEIVEKDGKNFMITLHPAAVLRFNKNEPLLRADFEKAKKLITSNLT